MRAAAVLVAIVAVIGLAVLGGMGRYDECRAFGHSRSYCLALVIR